MTVNEWQIAPASDPENRRLHRYSFGIEQQIAEIVNGVIPPLDAFEGVRCVDVSSQGFAFYRRTLPESSELIVAVGEGPDVTYLTAHVVHSSMLERWGHTFFRIGCQFTGHMDLPDYTLASKRQQDSLPRFC